MSLRTLNCLKTRADKICNKFGIIYTDILEEKEGVKRFGSCDEDGVIYIRLRKVNSKKFLQYKTLLHTLCHELAHCRYMNHGDGWKTLNKLIWDWVK